MSETKRKYDSTVARIAGNLLSGYPLLHQTNDDETLLVHLAVHRARAIVAETIRTEPEGETRDE